MSHNFSRRTLLEAVAAGAVGTVTLYTGARAQDAPAQKQSKQDAAYQDKPKAGQICGICAFFVAPTSCQKVEGDIQPTGWCKNFQLRK